MIELVPIVNEFPYYHVIFNYMIGDGDGETTYDFTCDDSQIEEVIKYVKILNKLKPLKGYWGICFKDYPKEYPGKYIGLSEEEYNILLDLLHPSEYDGIKGEFCACLRDEMEYYFLVFQYIDIYYYDKNNTEFKVKF